MTLEFAKPQNVLCNNALSEVIGYHLSELANNICLDYFDFNNLLEKQAPATKSLQITRINSELNPIKIAATNPISSKYHTVINSYQHIIKQNDIRLQDKKIYINEIISEFGDLKKIFHKNLEKGNYCNTITNHYLITEILFSESGIEKQIEFTFDKGELLIYSYTETKKDSNKNITFYKFVNFTDDGKSVIDSTENYVLGKQRLEIRRNAEGNIIELTEESGFETNAFYTKQPTHIIKKDKYGNILEYREYEYDNLKRIISAKFIKADNYYFIENTYQNNLIISNYKNCLGNVYWTRVFNNKIKRHVAELLFDNDGNLIREETFTYNKYGDLTQRISKANNDEILAIKEIKYNKHNSPIVIINKGKNGVIESEIEVA